MSTENAEAVRARYDEFSRADFSRLSDLPDDYEFVTSWNVPDAGAYRGDAAGRWTRSWIEAFDGLTVEAIEVIDAGDKVFVEGVQRGRPHGSETEVEERWWSVDTFRDGASVRTEIFLDRAEALEAAGLHT